MSSNTSHLYSEGQKHAYTSLCEMGDLFFNIDWADLAIKPRLAPLVIGPSGVGKSTVVKEVAKEFGFPCMRVSPSNWVVSGVGKDLVPTLIRVHKFVSENNEGIIHFDELDKFRAGSSDWSQYVLGEVFDLLDRAPSQPVKKLVWNSELIKKLGRFWYVGSGTWESAWRDTSKSKMGFGNSTDSSSIVSDVRRIVEATDAIPRELLRRFNGRLIVLSPATATDLRNAAENYGLARLASELKVKLDFDAAARSGLGARWLEETIADLLLQARREDRTDLFRFRPFVPDNEPDAREDDESGWDAPFSNWIFPK